MGCEIPRLQLRGIAAGPDVAIVDSDRVSRLKELAGEHAAEWFNTYSVTSGRPDRAHFYYRMTDEVRAFGNKRWAEPGIEGNVFEVKVQGGQVVAEGSIHPDTGQVYKVVRDVPLLAFPTGLVALIRQCYAKTNPTGKREWTLPVHDGEGRDDFLVSQAGKLRRAVASEAIIMAHLEELNSDLSIMADPKTDEDLDRIARSAARYDVPAPEPQIVIGGCKVNADLEPVEIAEKNPRPVFPDEAWAGTVFGGFAEIVCRGSFIRKRLASESFRAITGAIAGDQVTCGIAGVRMREYHATSFWEKLGRACQDVGIKHVSPHSFRHSYRAWLDELGTPVTVQQRAMRHGDIRVTMNYGDAVGDALREATSKLAARAISQ